MTQSQRRNLLIQAIATNTTKTQKNLEDKLIGNFLKNNPEISARYNDLVKELENK